MLWIHKELLPLEALQDYSKGLVVVFKQDCRQATISQRTFRRGIGQFCAATSEPSWDPKKRQPSSLHANHWRLSVFFKDPQALLAAESGFWPWLPQERTRGASMWAPSQRGLQSGCWQRPYQLNNAELVNSSMAEAASPVVASSEPTSVPSWARRSHDCLSRWNSRSGKTFRFFFIANRKWVCKKQLTKIKFPFICRLRKSSETFLQWMFSRNESKRIRCQSFEMQMGKKS
jgi:hypothetical protein